MTSASSATALVPQARPLVKDLLQPSARYYTVDMLITLVVAYGFAGVYFLAPAFSPPQIIALVISGFALHRLSNFMHEIVHLESKKALKSFRVAWNVLVGIPTLMPSYFFGNHIAHHNARQFGTGDDCEYVALARGPLSGIAKFMAQIFLQPVFVIVRFTVLTPISFLHPKLRQWTLENFSGFVFVWPCPREIPEDAPRAAWAAMDIACWLRASAIFVLVAVGLNPWYRIPQLYVLATFALSLHYFRSLTAHRYMADGNRQSFAAQLQDSIDIVGNRYFTELLYPIGLRYHALHHMFPNMPYHNLGIAHRRLMAHLPADSPYRDLVYPSVWSVLRELFQHSRENSAARRRGGLAVASGARLDAAGSRRRPHTSTVASSSEVAVE